MIHTKTQAIFFTKRRTKQLPSRPFLINNQNIEWEDSVKYLDLILDKKLAFEEHVNHVVNKATAAMRILYSIINRK